MFLNHSLRISLKYTGFVKIKRYPRNIKFGSRINKVKLAHFCPLMFPGTVEESPLVSKTVQRLAVRISVGKCSKRVAKVLMIFKTKFSLFSPLLNLQKPKYLILFNLVAV